MSASAQEIESRYRYAIEILRAAGSRALAISHQREQLNTADRQDLHNRIASACGNVGLLIRTLIGERYPEDVILSEENGGNTADARVTWMVEPIDGTRSFVDGLHNWCTALAVVVDDHPVIGAVFDPNHRELFHACRGGGAWLDDRRIGVHPARHPGEGLVGVGTPDSASPQQTAAFISALLEQGGTFFCNGSGALMSAWAAAGRLAGYYQPYVPSRGSLPGLVLMHEAGGITNDYRHNDGLRKGHPLLLANPCLWPQLNALLPTALPMLKT